MREPTPRARLADASYFVQLVGENFDGADLASVSGDHLRFDRCSFIGTDLRQATLDDCWFRFCDLRGARLGGASLRAARFMGCDLREADLRECDLAHATLGCLTTASDDGLTNVTGALLTGATLTDLTTDRVVGWPPG